LAILLQSRLTKKVFFLEMLPLLVRASCGAQDSGPAESTFQSESSALSLVLHTMDHATRQQRDELLNLKYAARLLRRSASLLRGGVAGTGTTAGEVVIKHVANAGSVAICIITMHKNGASSSNGSSAVDDAVDLGKAACETAEALASFTGRETDMTLYQSVHHVCTVVLQCLMVMYDGGRPQGAPETLNLATANMYRSLIKVVPMMAAACRVYSSPSPPSDLVGAASSVINTLSLTIWNAKTGRGYDPDHPDRVWLDMVQHVEVSMIDNDLADVARFHVRHARIDPTSNLILMSLGAAYPGSSLDDILEPLYYPSMRASLIGHNPPHTLDLIASAVVLRSSVTTTKEIASVKRLMASAEDWKRIQDKLSAVTTAWRRAGTDGIDAGTQAGAISLITFVSATSERDGYWPEAGGAAAEPLRASLVYLKLLLPAVVVDSDGNVRRLLTELIARMRLVSSSPRAAEKKCDVCGITRSAAREAGIKLKVCICDEAYYCGRACQQKAWLAGHKQACRGAAPPALSPAE
jgi:MYND finger